MMSEPPQLCIDRLVQVGEYLPRLAEHDEEACAGRSGAKSSAMSGSAWAMRGILARC